MVLDKDFSLNSRFVGFVFAHQLNKTRALQGGLNTWLDDMFDYYAYLAALERLLRINTKLFRLTTETKYHQMQSILSELEANRDSLNLLDVQEKLLTFYELLEEIETLTGLDITTDDDERVEQFIAGQLNGNTG